MKRAFTLILFCMTVTDRFLQLIIYSVRISGITDLDSAILPLLSASKPGFLNPGIQLKPGGFLLLEQHNNRGLTGL
jgi:hypothetical protein